jgi:hypothetical protein
MSDYRIDVSLLGYPWPGSFSHTVLSVQTPASPPVCLPTCAATTCTSFTDAATGLNYVNKPSAQPTDLCGASCRDTCCSPRMFYNPFS